MTEYSLKLTSEIEAFCICPEDVLHSWTDEAKFLYGSSLADFLNRCQATDISVAKNGVIVAIGRLCATIPWSMWILRIDGADGIMVGTREQIAGLSLALAPKVALETREEG